MKKYNQKFLKSKECRFGAMALCETRVPSASHDVTKAYLKQQTFSPTYESGAVAYPRTTSPVFYSRVLRSLIQCSCGAQNSAYVRLFGLLPHRKSPGPTSCVPKWLVKGAGCVPSLFAGGPEQSSWKHGPRMIESVELF